MRVLPIAVLAGVGSLAFAGAVIARTVPDHTLTVQLPNGAIEKIHYSGEVAPRVELMADPISVASSEWQNAAFGSESPIMTLDRMAAEMNQEAAAMWQTGPALALQPTSDFGPVAIGLRSLPSGAKSYQFAATYSMNGACTQSMEITSGGPGQKPQTISHSSGDCRGVPSMFGVSEATADASPANSPARQSVEYPSASPDPGIAREAAWYPSN